MIGSLTGIITLKKHGAIINVQGVGYAVVFTESTAQYFSSKLESPQTVIIYTHVKEDQLALFGFRSDAEKEMFSLLLTVSGVGPQTALALSNNTPATITTAVQEADVALFTKTPRVGKKLAQKIIIDLRSKLGELEELLLAPEDTRTADFRSALESLGFEDNHIKIALRNIDLETTPLDQAIKQALQLTHD